jgi:hypothetical protein
LGFCFFYHHYDMDGTMTTFTTEDREALEKGLEFFNQLKQAEKEDTQQMLRNQIHTQQQEIDRLNAELMAARKKNE